MSKSSLYGDSIFESTNIQSVNEAVVEAILAAVLAAEFVVIGLLIRRSAKNWKEVENYLSDPEIQKQFKTIYEQIAKGSKSDSSIKKYSKYFSYKNYKFDKQSVHYNPNTSEVSISFKFITIDDIDKIFKDVYGVTSLEYTEKYSETQPDNCKPAPKFKNCIKDIYRAFNKYIEKLKYKDTFKVSFELSEDDENLEFYYDSYGISDNEEISIDMVFRLDYKKIIEKAKNNKGE